MVSHEAAGTLSSWLQSFQARLGEEPLPNSLHVAVDNICFLMGCYTEILSSLLAADQRGHSISSHVGFLIGKLTTLCLASISISQQ